MLSKKIQEYDAELEGYVPILMAQAHVYWQLGHYSDVLRVLHQNKEFASEHETWKLNVAHTHFMMVSLLIATSSLHVRAASIWCRERAHDD